MPRHEPQRQCALTRQTLPTSELVRFALGPDGILAPDVDAKAPGRGVWITRSWASVDKAARKNVFVRALDQPVSVPTALADLTAKRLEQRLNGALGMARRAGQALTGATKVRQAIAGGAAIALFTASDAAADGRRKMVQTLNAAGDLAAVKHFEFLDSTQLGLALGGENVIHAALIAGAAGRGALRRAEGLAHFMADR